MVVWMAPEQPKHRTGEPSEFAGYRGAPGAGQLTGLALWANFKPLSAYIWLAVGNANRESDHKLPLFLFVEYCGASARKGIGLLFCEHPHADS
jgi:hypothetical protein